MIFAGKLINRRKERITNGNDPFSSLNINNTGMFVGGCTPRIKRYGLRVDASLCMLGDKSVYVLAKRNPDALRR